MILRYNHIITSIIIVSILVMTIIYTNIVAYYIYESNSTVVQRTAICEGYNFGLYRITLQIDPDIDDSLINLWVDYDTYTKVHSGDKWNLATGI